MTLGQVAGVTFGVLVIAVANIDGYLSLDPDQLRIFQGIMLWIGFGLVVVFTVGERASQRVLKTIESLNGWILQGKARAGLLLAVFILGYTVFWCAFTFARHYYFYTGWDLANQDQVVWNTAQGRPFSRSMEVTNDLADHVRPYLALLSLIYLVAPSPYVLLAFQSAVLGLSAWPLYRLARRKFDSPSVGLAVAFCALAYPPLGFLNRADFHAEVIAVPLLVAAYERIDANDLKNATLFLALALLGKENIGLTVAALGLVVAVYHKRWRFGLTWTVVGLAYSLTALFIVIPAFRGAPSDTLARYHWLGETPLEMLWTMVSDPVLVFNKLIVAEHFLTLFQLLAPLAFVPLLSPPMLIPAMPTLASNFMAGWPLQTTIYHQYMAPVIPFIAISGVLGLHRLRRDSGPGKVLDLNSPGKLRSDQVVGLGVSIMLLATLASWTYENPITTKRMLASVNVDRVAHKGKRPWTSSPAPIVLANHAAIREGLKHVPPDIYVLTTSNYVSHLSHRPQIGKILRAPVSTLQPGVEAIFVNLRDLRGRTCDDYLQNLSAAARSGFGVTFYRDGVLLVEKGKGDFQQLKDLLENWPACK